MQVVSVHGFVFPSRGGNLNMRQLLNPIFYSRDVRHPDSKRQRCSRQRTLERSRARKLKRTLIAPPEFYRYDIQDWRTF